MPGRCLELKVQSDAEMTLCAVCLCWKTKGLSRVEAGHKRKTITAALGFKRARSDTNKSGLLIRDTSYGPLVRYMFFLFASRSHSQVLQR